jgi:tetratricopeptide (TPR) repeat protein
MQCSKYNRECQYISKEDEFIFTLMPFHSDFDNVFDAIETAVKDVPDKHYNCTRADQQYTNHAIWCENICKPIHKAKYLIVDITGKNANVFYELGFAHAFENTEAIIITQNIDDAPFDIRDLGLIIYSPKDFKKLRSDLVHAINSKDFQKEKLPYIPKTSDEIIADLKQQIRDEEDRTTKFRIERKESEEREQKLKDKIRELEAIKSNPTQEAIKRISELESSIAEYKSKLKYTEDDKLDIISKMKLQLEEKEEMLYKLEKVLEEAKLSKDNKNLSKLLFDESAKEAEADNWFNKAFHSNDLNKKIEYYQKAILIKPDDYQAWYNMGNAYYNKKDFDKAIEIYYKAINYKPDYSDAWSSLGWIYLKTGDFIKAEEATNKAISYGDNTDSIINFGHLFLIKNNEEQAIVYYKIGLKNFNDKDKFFKAFDNDFQYLEKHGITKQKYASIRELLEDYINPTSWHAMPTLDVAKPIPSNKKKKKTNKK